MSRKKHEEHENAERWLLTYADMITLLMAFFIMLYTLAQSESARLPSVSAALAENLGGMPIVLAKPSPINQLFPTKTNEKATQPIDGVPKPERPMSRLTLKNIQKTLERNKLANSVKLWEDHRGVILTLLSDEVLFDIRSDQLKPEAMRALDVIGPIVEQLTNKVLVEGNSDQLTAGGGDPAINWVLSAGRALSVLKYLMKKGYVAENRLSLSAYAANNPLKTSSFNEEERRRLSRRVDIILGGELPPPVGETKVNDLKTTIEDKW